MLNKRVMKQIHNGLIVSCQARKGWPMYGEQIMAAFALAAQQGGAAGIRATEPENIEAIKDTVDLPIIGIYKQWYNNFDVYITPTYTSAKAVVDAGAGIVALDGTSRSRPEGAQLRTIIEQMHDDYPDIMIMADCDSVESAKYSIDSGADIVSSTLAGYTDETAESKEFDPELIYQLSKLDVPVVAEGHIHTYEQLRAAYENGAYSVVIGTAITRPEIITKGFVDAIKYKK